MRFEEAEPPAQINRRGREHKGLEAIFTSHNAGRQGEILTGIAGVMAGLFLSILAIYRTDARQTLGLLANTVYPELTLGALGVLLLIWGGGTIAFALSHRESNLSSLKSSQLDGRSAADSLGDSVSRDETRQVFGRGSKTGAGAVAFIQSLVLVALYSGFVQEFQSNETMQMWVRSNLPVGQSVLNWEAVLMFSAVLGLLMLQFLPGRLFSE